MVFKSLLGGAAAALDRAAVLAAYAQTARSRKRSRSERLGHAERVAALEALAARYRPALDAGDYYREARRVEPRASRVRAFAGGEVIDWSWPSGYRTFLPELDERYAARERNRQAAARLWLHPTPRPAVVLVHGYMAGQFAVEERAWPSGWLFHKKELDLAFFVLPFHGVRAIEGRLGPPPFPGSDPRLSNEGFRQAMGDLRDLVTLLLERGHPSVGIMGMSLGGYTTALAATVEPRLSFAVPVIPLTSLADFARDQGRLGQNPAEEAIEHRLLDEVHRVISPLHRPPRVDPGRVLVVAGQADRITPIAHAHRLADHFGAALESWHGGHLLQLGRRDKLRRVGRFIDETLGSRAR